MKQHKILVVEDSAVVRNDIVEELVSLGVPRDAILEADNLQDAEDLFGAWKDLIVAICLDGCLHDTKLNTIPLIKHFVDGGYRGILMAMSSDEKFRNQMVASGCTDQSEKDEVADLLVGLLRRDD